MNAHFDRGLIVIPISLGLSILLVGPALAVEAAPVASPDSPTVAEVIVTAEQRDSVNQIDRTVYAVKARGDAASLTATDVVNKLPGVVVDPSNKVTIRGGAAVTFLVDGKPVRRDVVLAIPASQIARVEVVTNPSVEFASSSGAFINIVLKKSAPLGWKGAISGKVDTLGGYDAGVNLTHGGAGWNVIGSLAVSVTPDRIDSVRTVNYDELQSGLYNVQMTNSSESSPFRKVTFQSKFARSLSDNENLSAVIGASINKAPSKSRYSDILSGPAFQQENLYNKTVRFNGVYPYAMLDYERVREGEYKISASLNAASGVSSGDEFIDGAISENSHDHTLFDYQQLLVDLDKYIYKKDKLSAGFAMSNNDVSDHSTLVGFSGFGRTERDDFRFDRKTYAAYATFQTTAEGADVKLGLRFERLDQDLRNAQGAIMGLKSIAYVLPSLHLSRSIGEHNSFRASFTVRNEVPDALNLNPELKYESPYLADQGNPFLRPASRRQAEIGHTYERTHLSFTQAVYYRDTKDDINNFATLGSDGVTVVSYTNLGSSITYGYASEIKLAISNIFDIGCNIDLYEKQIVAPTNLRQFESLRYNGVNSKISLGVNIDAKDRISSDIGFTSRIYSLGLVSPDTWTSEFKYTHSFDKKVSLNLELDYFGAPEKLATRYINPQFTGKDIVNRRAKRLRIGLSKSF